MLDLIVAIRCQVPDEEKAKEIRTIIDRAMLVFDDIEPSISSSVSQKIEPDPEPS